MVLIPLTEKLRRDLLQSKEETHTAIQEGMSYKQQAGKMECELDGARDQTKLLTDQVCRCNTDQVNGRY